MKATSCDRRRRACVLAPCVALVGCITGGGGHGFASGQDGTAAADGSDGGDAGSSAGDDDGATKLDVGADTGIGDDGGDCPGGGGDVAFSFIWIANSPEGTVSKIDTRTLAEVGRYRVSPEPPLADPKAGPSRTSVNQVGDVVVTDRDGGIAMILAETSECDEMHNGTPGLQTSTGPTDVLDFGADDCLVWRTALPVRARPAAWARASLDDMGCASETPALWTAAPDGSGAATVYLVDGKDGAVLEEIAISANDCQCPTYGLYGGAVDAQSNLWAFPRDAQGGSPTDGNGPLVRVDFETRDVELFPKPDGVFAYGIMVDGEGRPWVAGDYNSLARFDPADGTWTVVDLDAVLPTQNYVLRGLMQDAAGEIWIATMNYWETDPLNAGQPPGLLRVDGTDAVPIEFLDRIEHLPELLQPAGISIDVDGFVWLVDTIGDQAFKLDPADGGYEIVDGLNAPYTYSDMTGFGLANAGFTPQG